jgi:hypothetical protein
VEVLNTVCDDRHDATIGVDLEEVGMACGGSVRRVVGGNSECV